VELVQIPGKELSLDTSLWRYMSLSGFLLLLRGKTFIPSLRKLQENDPKELHIREHSVSFLTDAFLDLPEFQRAGQWLKEKRKSRTGFDLDRFTKDANLQNKTLVNEWLYQVSIRRCAWCWFEPAGLQESMAMWNLYAKSGVAINTKLENVASALKIGCSNQVLVARMQYCHQGTDDRIFQVKDYLKRPYLFKNKSYNHESEVRLVFRMKDVPEQFGVMLAVDPQKLLNGGRIIISPYILRDEAKALKEILPKLLGKCKVSIEQSSDLQERPHHSEFGESCVQEWIYVSKPLDAEDGLPDLFHEL